MSHRSNLHLLTVQPGSQRIEFHFTGICLMAPERVLFKYRLEGFDQDWVNAGTRRVAYYTGLSPGQYRFRVAACNNRGVWNEAGAVVSLFVQPAWWQTGWFRILLLAGVGGLGFLFYERRILRLKRARALQQAFSQRLIESQEKERKRIASELHDSLGQNLLVIKNRSLLGLQETGPSASPLEQLQEISQMASQALEEVREIARNLRPYQLDRLGLTKALQAIVTGVSRSSKVQAGAKLECIDGLLAPEQEINLYRIVQELFNNVMKHSQATEACLSVRRGGQKLMLEMQDNGCGFDYDTLIHHPRPDSSLGLSDISERVRILGGASHCESSPGQGTRWIIEIPVSLKPARAELPRALQPSNGSPDDH